MQTSRLRQPFIVALAFVAFACGGHGERTIAEPSDPPEVALGERLFLETRFAQYFAAHSNGVVNAPLSEGDPVMAATITTAAPLPGPFAGASMNCRACHLVDEHGEERAGGVRTYADFARRSPIPDRGDGRVTTPRNSPALVNASLARSVPTFFHFDGEFPSLPALVKGTFTGRNFGWLADESAAAIANLAQVIRQDNGQGSPARDFGSLPYPVVFGGTDPSIPEIYRIPEEFRLDVATATDEQIFDAVATLVTAYVESLVFARDTNGNFAGSPYDRFLRKNGLPRAPLDGESALDYTRRLRDQLASRSGLKFISLRDGSFALHSQEFRFDSLELQGLRIFLAEASDAAATQGVGNCVACHPAPAFTDFRFHNTGAAQDEYDAIHGAGGFAALSIPDLAQRTADPETYLPPSAAHPQATGIFLAVPALTHPGQTDLGVWNVLGNPAVPGPQDALVSSLCGQFARPAPCSAADLLPFTVALFKTPGLRDLGQSAPYLHTGQRNTIEDVLRFYITSASLARAGLLRNAAPQLADIRLSEADIAPVAAFLRALNEDYE
ncbi:MAG TPA: hypothetical protein VMW17_01470 [Candidatus Binatia bacterium]|nr:hypothetical protein [Candidatus Binatia bacterium]